MSKLSKSKLSYIKPVAILALVIIILGGVYSVVIKREAAKKEVGVEKADTGLEPKPTGLDSDEKVNNIGDVERVVAKWIESNPEAIIRSVITMQQKASEKQIEAAKKNVSNKKNDLFEHKGTPSIAPKGYDVSIVEFFDYNCGYCKKIQSTINKLIQEDKKVRVIFKEYPILGSSSESLSKVALAINMTDSKNYVKFHNALMESSARTEEEALNVAKNLGINVAKVKETLKDRKSEIDAQISFNHELGSSIGVNGTPAFIVGEEFISGAVEFEVLKQKIAEQRKK